MRQSKSGGQGDNPQGRLTNGENPQRLDVRDWLVNLDAAWITGFVDGEGCFHIGISKHPEMTLGYQVLPEFTVVQHERDVQLLYALKAYFGCGVVRSNHGDRMAFRVRGQENLLQRIMPFFEKHELKSKKRQDFIKFRRVLLLMEHGAHLTEEGLGQIREIADEMNRKSVKVKSGFRGDPED